MREEHGSTQGAGYRATGERAIQIRNFPCEDPGGGELSSRKESRSLVLSSVGRITPRDSRGDPGRRARYTTRALKVQHILKDESLRRHRQRVRITYHGATW